MLLRTDTGRWLARLKNGLYWGGRNGGRTVGNNGEEDSAIDTFGGDIGNGGELTLLEELLLVGLAVFTLRRWLLCAGGGVVTFSFLS